MTKSKDLIPINSEPPQVEIETVDEQIPTDAEIVKEMQALGFVKMTTGRLALYNKLGVHQNGHGILKGQRGMAFLTQARLNDALEILHRMLIEGVDRPKRKRGQPREEAQITTEQACQIAHEIAFGSGKLTESQELMQKLQPTPGYVPPPLPGDSPTRAVFPAGSVVVGQNSVVHLHQSQPEVQKPVEKITVEA